MAPVTPPRRVAILAVLSCLLLLAACGQSVTPSPTPPPPTPTPTVEPWSPPPSTPGPIEISYIDNCGFLIVGDGKKVLIDAHHLAVPEDIRLAILGADGIVPMHPSPYRFGSEELPQRLQQQYPKSLLFRGAMEPMVVE